MRPEQSDRLQPAGRPGRLRDRAYHVIFESEPGWGRRFDVVLIAAILASVGVVLLESVAEIRTRHASRLVVLEWLFTAAKLLQVNLGVGGLPEANRG